MQNAIPVRADYIVTGDRHLVGLAEYRGIKVLLVRQFLDSIEREQTGQ